MLLSNVAQGQMADELIGLSGGAVMSSVSNSTYTVPAGYTLVIHGCCFIANSAVAATLTIGGTTVFNATMAASSNLSLADRRRLTYTGGSGLSLVTNAYTSGAPALTALYTAGSTASFCAENAPYLFWPLAAGQTIVSNNANCVFYFWGTLIPT
jgi:hypothetical protein